MPHVTVSAPQTRGHTLHWATLYDVLFALLTGGRERTLRARIVALADLTPGRLLAVDFEPPRSRVARAVTRLVLTGHMADYDVRTCLPLIRAAGFVEVESGPTPYRWLTTVRGRVRDHHD